MVLKNLSKPEKSIDSNMGRMTLISKYVAPWALPKEEMPIHLVWKPDFAYDFIQILLPPGMEVKEFFNVESHEIVKSNVMIKNIKSPNFFGLVVLSNEIGKEQHEKKEIIVNFVLQNKVQRSHSFIANIYRPKLSILEKPKIIVLRDDSDPSSLVNLSLKTSGFGQIEVTTEVGVGGKFLPYLEPLYREMVRKLVSAFRLSESHQGEKKEIKINPLYIQQTTKDFIDKMRKGDLPLEIEKNVLEDFRAWLSDDKTHKQVVELVSKQLEDLLVDSLLFYFDRYPTEGVEMAGGKPTTVIESATHTFRIRFRYKDSMGNEYEPIQIDIPIEDLRKDKKKGMEVPINIQWVHEHINPLVEGVKC